MTTGQNHARGESGKSVLLTRQSDGTWRVSSYHDFPADFQKLSTFVGNLTDAKTTEFLGKYLEAFRDWVLRVR